MQPRFFEQHYGAGSRPRVDDAVDCPVKREQRLGDHISFRRLGKHGARLQPAPINQSERPVASNRASLRDTHRSPYTTQGFPLGTTASSTGTPGVSYTGPCPGTPRVQHEVGDLLAAGELSYPSDYAPDFDKTAESNLGPQREHPPAVCDAATGFVD